MNIQPSQQNQPAPSANPNSTNQTASDTLVDNNRSALSTVKLASHPNTTTIRPAFRPLSTSPFKTHFIIKEANKNLSTFFQSRNTINTPHKGYSDKHPFSDNFFDISTQESPPERQLQDKSTKLCKHTVSQLEQSLENRELLNAFKEGGAFNNYLHRQCNHPDTAIPLLKETASFCRQLIEELNNSPATLKQVEQTLAIFPPKHQEDYQCTHGTRSRLFEALCFFNRNTGGNASLSAYITQNISNTLQEYVSNAIVKYKLTDYIYHGDQIHLPAGITALLIGKEDVLQRDGFALVTLKDLPAKVIYKGMT